MPPVRLGSDIVNHLYPVQCLGEVVDGLEDIKYQSFADRSRAH
jgi:hypothetical protein